MAPLLGGSALHSEEIVVNLTREPASSAPVVIASASPMIAKPASSAPVIAKPASSAPVIAKPASSAPVIASALPMARATPLDTIVAPPEAPLRARPVETMIPSPPSSASRPVSDEMRREILRRAFERKPVFEERVQPAKTPEWQKAYTLGAGDVLNLALFKRPDLARSGIVVAPDGTVSYLQAIGIQAAGRTVDELRKDIEISLAEYHEDPRVVVSPASMGSKRYTIIGRVREPGSFALTRPTTVLEALATAQGVEVGSVGSTNVEIADMERSFVSRGGQKLDVDLAKLYREGDFDQNALLQPDDYIFIASALKNEYYVLGAVNRPGRRKMPTRVTVLSAIAEAGSYNDDAWRGRVLLVRGSIHHPETQVIDVNDILHGRSPDVVVQNRDIIYVSKRPFVVAEHALDSALKTFMQTVTAEGVNQQYISIPALR